MKLYCGFCDRYIEHAEMEDHVQQERSCQVCVICKDMKVGQYCVECGWCKGAPAKELGKSDWRRYIAESAKQIPLARITSSSIIQ